jgi:hypothetical protein
MATRMQQRRGTAAQWTAANPTLAAGEIGFETDTSKFKIGNGSSAWTALTYFANTTALETLLNDGAPAALNTLNEIAAAINDDPAFFTTIATNLTNHSVVTTNIHGITDVAALATATTLATAVSNHNIDTTNVHGITDTGALATTSYVTDAIAGATDVYQELAGVGLDWNTGTEAFDIDSTVATKTYADTAVSTHSSDTTSVHGIADTAALATTTNVSTAQTAAETTASGYVSTHNSATTNVHGIADTSILVTTTGTQTLTNKTITTPAGLVKGDVGLGNVDNTSDANKPVSSATQTALDAKLASATAATTYAPLASAALTGTPTAPTAAVSTNTTQIATTEFVRAEVAALVNSATSTLDTLGEIATALGNDANFSTTLTTNLGLKAPLASPTFTGTVTLPAAGIVFTDGTQAKEGVPSRTPIIAKTDSYTLSALTERDSLIEVAKASATTITIPLNSAVAFPIGTSLDILQTSTGQVTIAGTAGVTVNATPGLKLRTQWSSATLFKRAENTWVVYGDLTA